MICVADFTHFLSADMIGGKVVDLANPPLPLLDALFMRAGFADRPELVGVEASADRTYRGNCNGGLYSVPTRFADRSEEHTSELQSLMRISYAVFCLKKKKQHIETTD